MVVIKCRICVNRPERMLLRLKEIAVSTRFDSGERMKIYGRRVVPIFFKAFVYAVVEKVH